MSDPATDPVDAERHARAVLTTVAMGPPEAPASTHFHEGALRQQVDQAQRVRDLSGEKRPGNKRPGARWKAWSLSPLSRRSRRRPG